MDIFILMGNSISHGLISISSRLSREVGAMSFASPVSRVYNPLDYAFSVYREYLERFVPGPGGRIFLGMNPGPWGMAQTGIPFGAVPWVRDWMKISEQAAGNIGHPDNEHPKRPIQGFRCSRVEPSGNRFWGLMAGIYPVAEHFFAQHFVINYCPLIFLEEGGRNRTPDKLLPTERDALFAVCNKALADMVELLRPSWLIGIGKFAEKRLRSLFDSQYSIGSILHPSPASPAANNNWAGKTERHLQEEGIW